MSPDLLFPARIENSFLRNMKRLLTSIEWGFEKKSVRYDLDSKVLYVGGEEVIGVKVSNHELKVIYLCKA